MSAAHTRLITSALGSRPPPRSEAPALQAVEGRVLLVTAGRCGVCVLPFTPGVEGHTLWPRGPGDLPGWPCGGRKGSDPILGSGRPSPHASRDLRSRAFVSLSAKWVARGLDSAPPGIRVGGARARSRRPERGVWMRVRKGTRGCRATRDSAGQQGSQTGVAVGVGAVRSGPQVCPCQRHA